MFNGKRYNEMVRHLEAMVASGGYPPGTRIPSLRDLTEKFDLSMGTARRGIEYLVQRGLLEFRHGSGTYVAFRCPAPENGKLTKIAVFLFSDNPEETYCGQALVGAQSLAASQNCALLLNYLNYEDINDATIRVNSEGCAGMMFLGCYDLLVRQLNNTIPGAALSMHYSFGGLLSVIELDPFNAAEQASCYFKRQGKTHIKIISHDMPPHRARGDIFADFWRSYGTSEIFFFKDGAPLDIDYSDDRCGYYFVSGNDCQSASFAFSEIHGTPLAQQRCVVSVDGKSLFVHGYHQVNTIAVDWRDAGRITLEECLRRVENPGTPARRIYIDCRFHEISLNTTMSTGKSSVEKS